MKKCLKELIVFSVSAIYLTAPVFADGLVFDPENYNTKKAEVSKPTGVYANAPAKTANTKPAVNTKNVKDITNPATRETNSLQNALFELDSAQVDIRNQLLEERAKYTDIDTQYKLVKEQRKQQKKTIKDAEKKIKQIEKTKTQVRNSMGLAQ